MSNLLHWLVADRIDLSVEFGPALLLALAWMALSGTGAKVKPDLVDEIGDGDSS